MSLSNKWVFNLYFNYKDDGGKYYAEKRREEALIYMNKTMERMACFSVIAKDEHERCLRLRGYLHLNNPCTRDYIKKVLGKFSNCKTACFSDVVYLLKYFNVDKDITVTGELASGPKKDDANWVVRTSLNDADDFEKAKITITT